MNRKGTFIHWSLFGIIAAIGIFLFYANSFSITQSLQGPWQLEVINTLLYASELDLLRLEIDARNLGQTVALDLAAKGGFVSSSPCGKEEMVNLWNNHEQWCFPSISEHFQELFTPKLSLKKAHLFSSVLISGKRISANGGLKSIAQEKPFLRDYTYDYSFTVDLGYSFTEYELLQSEARKMVDLCRNRKDLRKCLASGKSDYWKEQSCDQPQAPTEGRIWSFCIESPEKAVLSNKPVRYVLALDFTPTKPFSIDEITIEYDQNTNRYEISFPKDDFAEMYMIYYSDANLLDFKGKVNDIPLLSGTGYFLKNREILSSGVVNDPAQCGSSGSREANKAYRCGDTITYTLEDTALLESEDYSFTVTTKSDGEEAEVALFVLG